MLKPSLIAAVAALALPLAAHAQTTTDRTKVTVKPNAVATTTVTGQNCYVAGKWQKCAKTETAVKHVMTTKGPVTKTATSTATPCLKSTGKMKTCVTKTKTVTPG